MTALLSFYWYGLLIAAGIGLFTGWWMWGHRAADAPIELGPDDELIDWPVGRPTPPPVDPRFATRAEGPDAAEPEGPSVGAPVQAAASVEDAMERSAPGLLQDVVAANDVEAVEDQPMADETGDILGPAIAAAMSAAAQPSPMVDRRPEPEPAGDEDGIEPAEAPDDLTMIKGIGPQLDDLLRSLGVRRFEDIAGWMPEDIERIDGQLGMFKGRIIRDEWIAQARLLARGDLEAFNQRYGHLP